MTALAAVRANALCSLIPPPRIRLSEWVESDLRLPEGVSALPGRVKLWPYQRDIADSIGDPVVTRVTVQKCVRVGYSTLLTGALGSYIANDPAPIMLLMPTESDCRDVVVSDLEPIFSASPTLAGLLSAESDEAGRNTLMSRRFPGGSLKVVAAKSPRNLRRHNIRVLLCDEVDAMDAGAEGSAIALAEKRTLSFTNRKIVIGSTPVYEATSHVIRAYRESDQRVFEVPCPACGAFTEIMWAHIEWQPDKPETAAFRCPDCEELIEERHKSRMVAAGVWRVTKPEVIGHHGYRLNALVSVLPNARWGQLALEFIQAKKSPDRLQTFVNTVLGEPWRESAEELDETTLASRAESFGLKAIPADVLLITVGVDVQRDRLECVFLGWGRDEVFVLGNAVIWGSPAEDDVWAELDDALKTYWPHPNGGLLKVDAAAVDAGDGETMDRVINYCRPRFSRRVVAIKGAAGSRPAIAASHTKGSRLFIVGVDGVKSQIVARLSRGLSIRFSDQLEARFYEEIASERLVVKYLRGTPVRQWERIPGRRAECLDAACYAWAVRSLVTVDLARREQAMASERLPTTRPITIKSAWLER
jgi:phage terminase large subunit GpA-like protein